ncbi:MAG: PIN domain-containing protein [Saprospiraceae bacterium]
MKRYVTDANVIFSCLISGREEYLKAFTENKFYLPDFALVEIQLYQSEILKKTKLPQERLKEFTLSLFDALVVVPNLLISTRQYLQAFQLCKDIDEKDTAYVALTLELEVALLSKDEELIEGLRAKGFTKVISLQEFFDGL